MSRRLSKISVVPADREKPHHKGTLFIQGIPATTKAAFKSACAKRGQNMRDVILKYMRMYATNQGVTPKDVKEVFEALGIEHPSK